MSDQEFVTFRKFSSLEEAEWILATLKEGGISTQVYDASPPVDLTFSVNKSQNEIRVRLKQIDFEKANSILERQAQAQVEDIPDDHYLHDFSDEELIEIVEKRDEWSRMDFLFAQKLLADRGKQLTSEEIEKFRLKRIEELKRPEVGHKGWLRFGYTCAVLGGFLGMFIGWFHWKFKKTIATGERMLAYDDQTRKTGERIFWLGVVFQFVWLYIAVLIWT